MSQKSGYVWRTERGGNLVVLRHWSRHLFTSESKKVKFSLCIPWRHTGVVEVYLCFLLTLAPEECGRSNLCPGYVIPKTRTSHFPLNRAPKLVWTFWRRESYLPLPCIECPTYNLVTVVAPAWRDWANTSETSGKLSFAMIMYARIELEVLNHFWQSAFC